MTITAELQKVSECADSPSLREIQQWLDACFSDADEETVLIRVVGSTESQQLNRVYRNKNKPTNVLSFPFEVPAGIPNDHLGDLVICSEVVASEAAEQGKKLLNHWAHMIIHGVLHLMGYDHINDSEAVEMEALEIRLLAKLAISNPYDQTM